MKILHSNQKSNNYNYESKSICSQFLLHIRLLHKNHSKTYLTIFSFLQFDGDGGGSIDFAEFLDLIAGKMKTFGENESSIRRAFRSLDKDHSGYITVKELKEVLNKLGEKMTTVESLFRDSFFF